MSRTARPKLHLEMLESRWCPALSVRSIVPDLFISGTPTGGPSATEELLVKQVAVNQFLVQETTTSGTTTIGTYVASRSIAIRLSQYNTNINLDLNGFQFSGNVSFDLGVGDTDPSTLNPVSVYSSRPGGMIVGNLILQNGSGTEMYNLGQVGSNPFVPAPLTIGGSVTVNARNLPGNPQAANQGDTLYVAPGATIQGDLRTTFVDSVDIGEVTPTDLTRVQGNVSINLARSPNELALNIYGFIGKNVMVYGTSLGDQFSLSQTGAATGGVIQGNLTVNLASASNIGEWVSLGQGTVVGGNVLISTQGGASNTGQSEGLYTIAGSITGLLSLSMGEGDNSLGFSGAVAGSMSVKAGNGNNDLTSTPFSGTVGGYLRFTFGNGVNTATITQAPTGLLYWNSGSGNNTLTLAPTTDQVWNVNLLFGPSDDTLNLAGSGTQLLLGRVNGGGRTTANSLTQGPGWGLSSTLLITNFP